ncbi:hypothetical protein GCM10022240_23060 [Microbacterium kribbense]|uniref:DUF6993 domain-containing protein n=1 Tax=Microbacterium kribbense TaxID=433645 RepID=A0ABP7GPG5_9MICO
MRLRPVLASVPRRALTLIVALGVAVTLAGCTGGGSADPVVAGPATTGTVAPPASVSPPPVVEPSGTPGATSTQPHAAGTAQQNLPRFRAVVAQVAAGAGKVEGRAYIDALVTAGFDKKAMQVTQDQSTVGHPAESIEFSVRWPDGQCLVGQVGPDTGAPVTTVLPGLAGGGCLLGATRVIDW